MNQFDDLIEEFKRDLDFRVGRIKDYRRYLKRPHHVDFDSEKFKKSILFRVLQVNIIKLSIKILISIRDKGTYPMQEYYDFMDDSEDYIDHNFPIQLNKKWIYENRKKWFYKTNEKITKQYLSTCNV